MRYLEPLSSFALLMHIIEELAETLSYMAISVTDKSISLGMTTQSYTPYKISKAIYALVHK
jgi:hypothetical protein